MINDTIIFKGSKFVLSLLRPHFTNSSCNDSLIRVRVNRTLSQQTETHLTTANYTISIGVKEEYRRNYSILTKSTGTKIDQCYDTIINDVITKNRTRFILYFALNISGDRLIPRDHFLHEPTQNTFCDEDIIMCPQESTNVAQMCGEFK